MGKHPDLLREGATWIYAMGADRRKPRSALGGRGGKSGERSRRKCCPTRAGLAAAAVAGNAADSGHVQYSAPRRQHGRGETEVNARGMESFGHIAAKAVISYSLLVVSQNRIAA